MLFRLLRLGVLVYEVFRVLVLAALLVTQSNNSSNLVMIICAVPAVLLPIMALFINIDSIRYKEYLPLLIVGKVISIFVLLCWSLFSRQNTMIGTSFNEITLVICDLLALVTILVIYKDNKKMESV